MLFMTYGRELRLYRKLAHRVLGPSKSEKYHDTQEKVAAFLANDILSSPENFFEHVQKWV